MPDFLFRKTKKPLYLLAAFALSVNALDANAGAQSIRNSPYQLALPGYKFAFPRDHGAHPQYSTEWWYYTGHLRAKNGRRFGYQLTWFRQALLPKLVNRRSNWATRDVVFAHFALTDENNRQFYFTDRISRGAAGVAGTSVVSTRGASSTRNAHIWINDWDLRFTNNLQTLSARGNSNAKATENAPFSLELRQTPLKPLVVHGAKGVSQKAAGLGRASHYYSFTRLKTVGQLKLNGETLKVEGQSWFDHEFGSNQLAKNQIGWDWFALQLNDGRELMLYRMRLRGGGSDPFSSGTLIEKNGRSTSLGLRDFSFQPLATWQSARTNATYPSKWRVQIPRAKLDLTIEPTVQNQELITARSTGIAYWEGSVRVLDGGKNVGQGYVELTGYDKPFSGTF